MRNLLLFLIGFIFASLTNAANHTTIQLDAEDTSINTDPRGFELKYGAFYPDQNSPYNNNDCRIADPKERLKLVKYELLGTSTRIFLTRMSSSHNGTSKIDVNLDENRNICFVVTYGAISAPETDLMTGAISSLKKISKIITKSGDSQIIKLAFRGNKIGTLTVESEQKEKMNVKNATNKQEYDVEFFQPSPALGFTTPGACHEGYRQSASDEYTIDHQRSEVVEYTPIFVGNAKYICIQVRKPNQRYTSGPYDASTFKSVEILNMKEIKLIY